MPLPMTGTSGRRADRGWGVRGQGGAEARSTGITLKLLIYLITVLKYRIFPSPPRRQGRWGGGPPRPGAGVEGQTQGARSGTPPPSFASARLRMVPLPIRYANREETIRAVCPTSASKRR